MTAPRHIVAWTSLTLDGYTSGSDGPAGVCGAGDGRQVQHRVDAVVPLVDPGHGLDDLAVVGQVQPGERALALARRDEVEVERRPAISCARRHRGAPGARKGRPATVVNDRQLASVVRCCSWSAKPRRARARPRAALAFASKSTNASMHARPSFPLPPVTAISLLIRVNLHPVRGASPRDVCACRTPHAPRPGRAPASTEDNGDPERRRPSAE
jgi:hypothetical protein